MVAIGFRYASGGKVERKVSGLKPLHTGVVCCGFPPGEGN